MLILLKEHPVADQWRAYRALCDVQQTLQTMAEEVWSPLAAIIARLTRPEPGAQSAIPLGVEPGVVDWEREIRVFEHAMVDWQRQRERVAQEYRRALSAWEEEKARIEEYNYQYRHDIETLRRELYEEALQRWRLNRSAVMAHNQQLQEDWQAKVARVLQERERSVGVAVRKARLAGGFMFLLTIAGLVQLLLPAAGQSKGIIATENQATWLLVTGIAWLISVLVLVALSVKAYRRQREPLSLPDEPAYQPLPAPPDPDEIQLLISPEKEVPPRPQPEPLPPCPSLPALPAGFDRTSLEPLPQPLSVRLVADWLDLMLARCYPNWNDPLPGQEVIQAEHAFARWLSEQLDDAYLMLPGIYLDRDLIADIIVVGPSGVWVYAINYWEHIIAWTEREPRWQHWERRDKALRLRDANLPTHNHWQRASAAVERHLKTRFPWLWKNLPVSTLVHGAVVFAHPQAELRVGSPSPGPFIRFKDGRVTDKCRNTTPQECYPIESFDEKTRVSVADALLERDWKVNGLPLHHSVNLEADPQELRKVAEARFQSWQAEVQAWQNRLILELKRLAVSARLSEFRIQ